MAAVSCRPFASPFLPQSGTPDCVGSTVMEAQIDPSSVRPKADAAAGAGSDESRQLRLVDQDVGLSKIVRRAPSEPDPSAHPSDRLPDTPDDRSLAAYTADLGPGSACFCCGAGLVTDVTLVGALDCPTCGARVEHCVAA